MTPPPLPGGYHATSGPTSGGLRVGIVGIGSRAQLGTKVGISGLGQIVVAADPTTKGRERARQLFRPDVSVVSDHRELLAAEPRLDAVVVTSPDDTHAEIAIDLLRAGVPVYLEKPIATTAADADEVLRVAAETGTRLYVGHNMRHMAVVKLMRDIIDEGRNRRGQSDLVPPLRRQRRGLLLQGLARRPDARHRPAAAEGCPRHRRHPLAGRRVHPTGRGDG